jgi:shikimate kinase
MKLALIGLPGSGKSTVGKQLAKRLGVPFLDSDEEIEKSAKMSIRAMFEQEGEAAFMDLEAEVIARLCEQQPHFVLSTGGGAVIRAETRDLLRRSCTVVYLRSDVDCLWRRLRNDTRRPLLQGPDGRRQLQALAEARGPLYESTANFVVETGHTSVSTTVNMISMQVDLAGIGDHSASVGRTGTGHNQEL